jgi:hypothetical protein
MAQVHRDGLELSDYLKVANWGTVLSAIPEYQSVAKLLAIPMPADERIAWMFTKFLTLMDHFLLHYSSLPCALDCPCHRQRSTGVAVDEPWPDLAPLRAPPAVPLPEVEVHVEENESKEEKRSRSPAAAAAVAPELLGPVFSLAPAPTAASAPTATPAAVDKSGKFRFDVKKQKHCDMLEKLIPIFLNIMSHMGVILHGLHTCGVERFARERFKRVAHARAAATAQMAVVEIWMVYPGGRW